ncbi:hypothetical protein Drose_19045 [Dactylosporangium roseum]|uniref:Secreted protein n=1 Tax=Dactylosporangium roseum TaxID=47989 RepID=A0ABY5YXA2_9ACTN|nr:hypothetical protein [Dactylosporangium roseum]UWZ33420.1 hypothetical protein Drose_19045 [Dactylosporangium roseum]
MALDSAARSVSPRLRRAAALAAAASVVVAAVPPASAANASGSAWRDVVVTAIAVQPKLRPDSVKTLLTGTAYTAAGLTQAAGAGAGGSDAARALAAAPGWRSTKSEGRYDRDTDALVRDAQRWADLEKAVLGRNGAAAASAWNKLSPASRDWAARLWAQLDPAARSWATWFWAARSWAGAGGEWAARTWAARSWAAWSWASGQWSARSWSWLLQP